MKEEAPCAGGAVVLGSAETRLTPLIAAPTPPHFSIAVEPQGTGAHARPAGQDVSKAEMDAVQTVISIWAVTALIPTFGVARTIILILFLHDLLLLQLSRALLPLWRALKLPGARAL